MKNLVKAMTLILLLTSTSIAAKQTETQFDIRTTMAVVARVMGISGVSSLDFFGKSRDGKDNLVYSLNHARPASVAWRLRQLFLGKKVTVEVDEGRKAVVIKADDKLQAKIKAELAKIDVPKG